MNKFKIVLSTLKYLLLAVLPFLAQETKGQVFPLPPAVINPFISPDTTDQAIAYNLLNLAGRAARDAEVQKRINDDRTSIDYIPGVEDLLVWNCQKRVLMHMINTYAWWGEGIYDNGGKLLFNGYRGFELEKIYENGGTFADQGKLGLPLFQIDFGIDPLVWGYYGHAMTSILTGNDALNGKDWNDIEPAVDYTNVKPGEMLVPMNTEEFKVTYPFVGKTNAHEKVMDAVVILKFKIVNGEKILTYNINDNPNFNTTISLITKRDTLYPDIQVSSPLLNKVYADSKVQVVYNTTDENLVPGSTWYSLDGGNTKTPMEPSGSFYLYGLHHGDYVLTLGAEDYFRLKTVKEIPFRIDVATSVESLTMDGEVTIFPMPAKDYVNVRTVSDRQKLQSRTLYNANGKQVYNDEVELSSGENIDRLDISNLTPGLYFLKTVERGAKEQPKTYNILKY